MTDNAKRTPETRPQAAPQNATQAKMPANPAAGAPVSQSAQAHQAQQAAAAAQEKAACCPPASEKPAQRAAENPAKPQNPGTLPPKK